MVAKRILSLAFALLMLNGVVQRSAAQLETWRPVAPTMTCWAGDDPHYFTFTHGWETLEYQIPCPMVVADNCPTRVSDTKFSIVVNTVSGFPALIRGAYIILKNAANPTGSGATTIQFTDSHIYINGKQVTANHATEKVKQQTAGSPLVPMAQLPYNKVYTAAETNPGCNCNFRVSVNWENGWRYYLEAIDHKFEFTTINAVYSSGGGYVISYGRFDLTMEEGTWRGSRKVCGLCGDKSGMEPFSNDPNNDKGIVRTVNTLTSGEQTFNYAYTANKIPWTGYWSTDWNMWNQGTDTRMIIMKSWIQSVPWVNYTPSQCAGGISFDVRDCQTSATEAETKIISDVCNKMKTLDRYKYCSMVVNLDTFITACKVDVCNCKNDPSFSNLPNIDPMTKTGNPPPCPFLSQAFESLEKSCAFTETTCSNDQKEKRICSAAADDQDDGSVTCPPSAFLDIVGATASTMSNPTDPLCASPLATGAATRDASYKVRAWCQGKNACKLDMKNLLKDGENIVTVQYKCMCQSAGGGSNCPANSALQLVSYDTDLTDNADADARMLCVCSDGYKATYDDNNLVKACTPVQCPVPDPTTAGYMRFENCNGQTVGSADCLVSCARPYILAPSNDVPAIPEGAAQMNVVCAARPGEAAQFMLPSCTVVLNKKIDSTGLLSTLNSFVAPAIDLAGNWKVQEYDSATNQDKKPTIMTLVRDPTTPSLYKSSDGAKSYLLNPDGGLYPCDTNIQLGEGASTCYYDSATNAGHARILAGSRTNQSVVVWCNSEACKQGAAGSKPESVWESCSSSGVIC